MSNSDALASLLYLRRIQEENASLRAHRVFQKKTADSSAQSIIHQEAWFRGMKNVLEEMDQFFGIFSTAYPLRFLDIGCCPGGFSSYVLSKCPRASGVGVSLPVESGGHACLLEDNLKERYELKWAGVTLYRYTDSTLPDDLTNPFPFLDSERFDVILVDGHPLRTSCSKKEQSLGFSGDRILVSQILLALRLASHQIGTTVVIKLAHAESMITKKIIYMLDILSAEIATWKPVYIHATRPTFYVVVKGVGLGSQSHRLRNLISDLTKLWTSLMTEFAHGNRRQRRLSGEDFNFVIGNKRLHEYTERYSLLANHIYQVEAASLEGWYATENIGI